jgi:hypothetical protein
MQAQYLRHRRRARAPRAAQAEHQRAHRGERMAIERAEIYCAACGSRGRTHRATACRRSARPGSWATTAISRPAPCWAFAACYTFAIYDLLAATDRCPNRGSAAVDHLLAAIADDRANRGSTGINDLGPCAYRSRAARGPVDPLRGLRTGAKTPRRLRAPNMRSLGQLAETP